MDLWTYLSKTEKPIWLYGMGDGAEKVMERLEDVGVTPAGVFASDAFARRNNFCGFEVIPYSEAKIKCSEMIVLVCFGTQIPEVIDNIKKISAEQELYIPDVPVYGDGTFNEAFLNKYLKEVNKVYDILADEQSRFVFNSLIEFKLTGNPESLFASATPYGEVYENIITLSSEEVFLDLGAYKGDTVEDFIKRAGGKYNYIYAVEPDKKIYNKLINATNDIKNFTALNAAISNTCGTIMFSMKGGRNSSACAGGGVETSSITVDEIAKAHAPTFIKFDVEGAENAAINGARNTIFKHKPKMQIAAYHRNEDIFNIPLTVHSIRDDYKIYLRRNPCVPAWDINYFFI